jgi:transcription initiation factor IIE alpha subunit
MLPESEFAYGERVLSALCNVTPTRVRDILNQLAEERLILVTELEYKGRKYRTYRTNFKKVYACLNTKKDKNK